MPDKIVNHFVLADGSVARYDYDSLVNAPDIVDSNIVLESTTYTYTATGTGGWQGKFLQLEFEPLEDNKTITIKATASHTVGNQLFIIQCYSDIEKTTVLHRLDVKSSNFNTQNVVVDSIPTGTKIMAVSGWMVSNKQSSESLNVGDELHVTGLEIYFDNGGYILKDNVSVLKVNEQFESLLKVSPYDLDIVELGTINMSTTPFSYGNSTSRVRTLISRLYPLKKGDVISLADGYVMYVGWKATDGTWHNVGWRSGDYTVTSEGAYAVLWRYTTEATITDFETIAKALVIYKYSSVYNAIENDIFDNQRRKWFVKSINHRGYSRFAPENTIPAFQLSAKYGWDYVETDVRFTSDGVPVLLHDESINRTARNENGSTISGTVNISDITYAQALTYDFGIWMGDEYAGTKIPTLDEFLTLCKKLSLGCYLELKGNTQAQVNQIVAKVNRHGMNEHVTYISFSEVSLGFALVANSHARVGLVGDLSSELITTASNMKTSDNDVFLDVHQGSLTTELVDACANANIPLEIYTPNFAGYLNSYDDYISGATSDWLVAGKALYDMNNGYWSGAETATP